MCLCTIYLYVNPDICVKPMYRNVYEATKYKLNIVYQVMNGF